MIRTYALLIVILVFFSACDKIGDDGVPPSPETTYSAAYDIGFSIEPYDYFTSEREAVFGSLHTSKVLSVDDMDGRGYDVSLGYDIDASGLITLQSIYQVSINLAFPAAWTQSDPNLCQIEFTRLSDFDNSDYDMESITDEFSYNRYLYRLTKATTAVNEVTFDPDDLADGDIYYQVEVDWLGASPNPTSLKGILRVHQVIDNAYIHKISLDGKMLDNGGQ